MIKNYLKIAWRNLIRDRSYSIINIIGLTIGLTACFLLVLFVRFQFSFDSFHEHTDRIFRMTSVTDTGDEIIKRATSPVPLASTLKKDLPEIEKVTHISRVQQTRIKIYDQTISVENFYWASQDIFDIFSFSVLQGNKSEFLTQPGSVVITQKIARRYFSQQNPIGTTIQLNDDAYTISGVVKDWPANAHFHPQFIASFSSLPASDDNSWFNFNTRTYFLLQKDASIQQLEKKLPSILKNYFGERSDEAGFQFSYNPQPLSDIHLHSSLEGELEQNGSILTLQILMIIALLILLNACVNYINLSTARAYKRAKEVGIRKVLGSKKAHLIIQFMGEALMLTAIAFLLSLVLLELCIPGFNKMFNQHLNTAMLFEPITMVLIFFVLILTSLLAGLYPAFYLTSFSVNYVLKGAFYPSKTSAFSTGRKTMVVFQFLICISLMISSVVILKQIKFIQQKNLGFNENNLVVIPLGTNTERSNFEPLRNKLLTNPKIAGVTSAVNYPGRGFIQTQHWLPGNPKGEFAQMGFVGTNFLDIFEIDLKLGQNFNNKDQHVVIINETAVQRFGLGKHPVGKRITRTDPVSENRTMYEIIGVVEDFNIKSLRESIPPVVLYPVHFNVNMIVRISPAQTSKILAFIRESFKKANPDASFEYHFVSDSLADYYRSDQNFFRIITSFTLLAIFIAGLGLLGLIGYAIQSRTKEIGIRKVLGASVANIVALLSKDFVRLVLIGFVIAIPIAWYAMNRWLADFAYKIEIGPGIFVLAGATSLLIALLTVSWQSIKAALANPVESLKSE